MKIAVSSSGPSLDAPIDPRFGRCQYFIIVDSDTMQFEAIPNPNIAAGGGAGIQSAQLVANKGAQVVITGGCGPNAFQTLSAAGVQLITGLAGTVREAVELYKSGQLQPSSQPSTAAHFGMGGGAGGFGRGMGRGMGGQGGGRSAGGGFGVQPSYQPPSSSQQAPSSESDLKGLKDQIETLRKQLEETNRKIKELEKEGESE